MSKMVKKKRALLRLPTNQTTKLRNGRSEKRKDSAPVPVPPGESC